MSYNHDVCLLDLVEFMLVIITPDHYVAKVSIISVYINTYGMTFISQREEKEKNLKNFANNFFMDIIL